MRTEYVRMGDAPVRYFDEWRILVNKTLSGKHQVRIQREAEGQCWSGMDGTRAGAFEVALAGLAADLRGREA